jgi:hypothetical protein
MSVILKKLLVNTSSIFNKDLSGGRNYHKKLKKVHATLNLQASEELRRLNTVKVSKNESRDYLGNITLQYSDNKGAKTPHYYNHIGPGHYNLPDVIGSKT